MNKTIEPYKTSLSKINATTMAQLANLVYQKKSDTDQTPDQEEIINKLRDIDSEYLSVYGFDKNSAQAMVVSHKDFIGIAFRGTNEINDWLDNLNAFPEIALFGKFHRGFYRSVEDLWSDIKSHVEKIRQDLGKKPVFITGHSLGGAMASVAAAKYIHKDEPFTSVYTFGQPRAMTRNTARTFNAEAGGRYFRFQNNEDIVTRVPARIMNYSHVGKCLYIDQKKAIHNEPGYWFKFLDTVDGALESVKNADSILGITDHDMGNYLDAILKWDFQT